MHFHPLLGLRCYIFIKNVSASCKYSSNRKSNIIKTLNSENKYIYGKLLETQKQRRKTVSKALNTISVENISPAIDEGFDDNGFKTENSNKKAHKQRIKKCKEIKDPIVCPLSTLSLSSEVPVQDNVLKDITHQTTESNINKEPLKLRTRKPKKASVESTPSCADDPNDVTIAEDRISSFPDQFVFKTTVPIDESHYPLENIEKLELLNKDSAVETVLNYSFTDSVIQHYTNFPSVSKIMEETMPDKNKIILSKWRRKMINELGEDGFKKHVHALKSRGQEFHTAVRNAVLGMPPDVNSEITQNTLKSLSWMLEHVSNPLAVESITAHTKLGYKGIPDCVALFKNIPVVIDWKLSDKPKKDLKDTYEAPVQITAYIGALNHDPNYKWGVSHGLVAVAYTNGDPCDVFLLAPKHCQIYWRHWLLRLNKFVSRSHLHLDHDIDEKSLELC